MDVFHKHKWQIFFRNRLGRVQYCAGCNEYQTCMYDYVTCAWVSLPGNLLASAFRDLPIFVLAGNQEQFIEARRKLMEFNYQSAQIRNLNSLDLLEGQVMPTVILYGSWYERDDLVQDPRLTNVLNGPF